MRTKEAMKGKMNRWVIYGGEGSSGKIQKMFETEEMIGAKGRPKKNRT